MSKTLGQNDFLELLLQLETRCKTDPLLTGEWEESWKAFESGGSKDIRVMHRFREWFLLERPASSLGAPPAVAWAPDAPEEDSLWHRLLDSYFGIFQGMGNDSEGFPLLEDLWSGRQIRLIGGRMSIDKTGVLLGRVAVGGEDHHVPLSGATFLVAPGLADALAKDLSSIRAKQPRFRLSQQQCETILEGYLDGGAEQETSTKSAADLERILEGSEEWTPKKVIALIERLGTQEALNTLAFETTLDLEALRNCFLVCGQEPNNPEKNTTPPGVQLDQETVDQALCAYDLARESGIDLEATFASLEQELGMDSGMSDPYQDVVSQDSETEESVGIEEVPGTAMLLATYLWEKEQEHIHLARPQVESITAFLEFLQDIQERPLDPEEVQHHQLLAYLCRSQDIPELEKVWKGLDHFLHWLRDQQSAPIQCGEDTLNLARQVVAVNSQVPSLDSEQESMTWVTATDPLGTEAEDGESVPVVGWPADLTFQPQKGDALRGSWGQGKFHLAAWFPKALLPKATAVDSGK